MARDGVTESSPFMKQLASSDAATRQEAFTTLSLYLQRDALLTHLELLKLWKGLFFCMWLTPNPRPQQQLAQDFASLVTDTLSDKNVLPFVDAFWETLGKEWAGIDSHRMDKYMRLARFMLRASLRYLSSKEFDSRLLTRHNEILERTPLNPVNEKIPNGLRYHVLDIYVDEIEHVQDGQEDSLDVSEISALLTPVEELKSRTHDPTVRKRAKESLSDERLTELGLSRQQDGTGGRPEGPPDAIEDDFEGFGD